MLQFLYGSAGTGKTTKIIQCIGEHIKRQEQVLLLVPEQFSFESERRLYREFGAKSSLYVEVLTFTRLCNSIFREFGGLAGQPVTEAAKCLLMSIVVNELQDQLSVYKKSAGNSAFLETLLGACSEFKTAGITPAVLKNTAIMMEEGKLKEKMTDLSLVYTGYQSLLEKGYVDPEDDIFRACEILENHNFFEKYHLYIDSFTTFMSGEFGLLQFLIAQARSATFAFTTDKLFDTSKGVGVFSVVQEAIKRLSKIAEKQGVPQKEPIMLLEPVRYRNQELAYLSKEYLQSAGSYKEKAEGIALFTASSAFRELEVIAATIARLVRTDGYRYNEFAVISRNPSDLLSLLELVFGRYQIPYFADQRVEVEQSPLVSGLLAALQAAERGFPQNLVLAYGKSPILGLEPTKVAALENYCYTWQISGKMWGEEFVNHPRGMVEDFTKEDRNWLFELNEIRRIMIEPLEALRKGMQASGGEGYARSIYTFLEKIRATEHLFLYGQNLSGVEGDLFLATTNQIWEALMDILDIFGNVLENISFDVGRYNELFRLALISTDIGVLPQTLDQVLVGGADRIRPDQKRVVFVIGVNEGVFPVSASSLGVFTETEREKLHQLGLEVGRNPLQTALLEQFFGYFAMTLPSEKLIVSCSSSNLQGKEQLPSVFFTQLERLFPHHKKLQLYSWDFVEAEYPALSLLAESAKEDSSLRATLWEYFSEKSSKLVTKIQDSAWKPTHTLHDKDVTARLFGDSMRLSPSKIERYFKCPFSYFVRDGLKLYPRTKVEFSPLESGSLLHHVLQLMMERYQGAGLAKKSVKELEEEIEKIIQAYLEDRVQRKEQLPKRFVYQFQRLCGTLARLLSHLGKEFAQSEFKPIAYELEIGKGKAITPVTLTTPSGVPVVVEGVIDRVDVMEKDGKQYIRVVDYKSGSRTFQLSDVLYGLNLQMLIYLFTLKQQTDNRFVGSVPAGVLYMPIRENYMNAERGISKEKAQKDLEKQWVMSGVVLEDEMVLKGMEEQLEGVFIPAEIGKNGKLLARSSTIQLEAMEELGKKVEEAVRGMAEALGQGDISAYPTDDTIYPSCTHCDYRQVCGYEQGDSYRPVERLSHNEVIKILDKEDAEEGEGV